MYLNPDLNGFAYSQKSLNDVCQRKLVFWQFDITNGQDFLDIQYGENNHINQGSHECIIPWGCFSFSRNSPVHISHWCPPPPPWFLKNMVNYKPVDTRLEKEAFYDHIRLLVDKNMRSSVFEFPSYARMVF